VWRYTPRQIAAHLRLSERRRKKEQAVLLNIAYLGARGDWKEVNKLIRDWGR
jgi:hypothetical protein